MYKMRDHRLQSGHAIHQTPAAVPVWESYSYHLLRWLVFEGKCVWYTSEKSIVQFYIFQGLEDVMFVIFTLLMYIYGFDSMNNI